MHKKSPGRPTKDPDGEVQVNHTMRLTPSELVWLKEQYGSPKKALLTILKLRKHKTA